MKRLRGVGRLGRGVIGALVVAIGCSLLVGPAARATPNTSDSFYQPPAGYEATVPGTILRTRPITAAAQQLIPLRVRAWQLLYRTTSATGDPYAAVTTVLAKDDGRAPTAVLSYNSMIDAIAPECMPSQVLRAGSPWFDFARPGGPVALGTTASESLMIAAGLEQGWAVSVPDLGGVDNHFLTPREPGYVALDGVRAVKDFAALAVAPGAPAALWGYSGGGIASNWAAEVQPTYAPELPIAGVAVGAPVVDLPAALRTGNGTPVAGLVGIGVAALSQDSPEFAALMDSVLTPEGKRLLDGAAASCTPQNLLSFVMRDFDRLTSVPLAEIVDTPLVRALIEDRALGTTAPTAPLYVYNAVDDELSTIESADRLVEGYCAAGTAVTYRRDLIPSVVSAHTFGWGLGAPGAFAWLKERMADAEPPRGCDVQTLSTPVTPEALSTLGPDYLVGMLRAVIGR
ncbi:lipase family protein [Nocardia sp. AG03]|uniref:lipase family protein n=1 Tax=Nocardia sp. AG03 TaxID=3025312 RepID=UPI00241885B1|nr:lipase family protein [Nocardia sp. AG03]